MMARVFVALELPGEIRERLGSAQETLRDCSARLTWVDPALIHITLKFLGEVPESDIPRIGNALKSVVFQPFPVTVGAVTVNNPKRPFTVWSSIDDHGQGKTLFRMVEDVLTPLGFGRETRGFTPHATLARVKEPHPSLFTVLDAMKGTSYGTCVIGGMKLKKSTLTPRGPLYEDLVDVVW